MYTFEKSIFINRPQQEVFDFVTNPANATQWESTTESAEWISDGPPGVGSTINVVIKLGWLKITTELEITDWNPFNMYSYKGSDSNLQAGSKIKFEANENGTQVTQNSQIEGVGLMKLLEGLFGRQAKKSKMAAIMMLSSFYWKQTRLKSRVRMFLFAGVLTTSYQPAENRPSI